MEGLHLPRIKDLGQTSLVLLPTTINQGTVGHLDQNAPNSKKDWACLGGGAGYRRNLGTTTITPGSFSGLLVLVPAQLLLCRGR
ncbi:hypothetical protein XELAEV_18016206mg [Xenopus laevis]|uniref:Uncharacterized protein n=1 Tax=Xenopus laevis TaxID=8355 RepID=A0A974DLW1_XENLA|nr:hypothetical protein XELAEV_18016206mg [Xenopus laevis]